MQIRNKRQIMSYKIEPMSVREFVDDNQMKLPRFQRKATWNDKQNFELAISIFQDYPVGVVIVNKEPDSSWLLDGRQRRAALKMMRENPDEVYKWAKKYIKFKPNSDNGEVRAKYWERVEEYLQKDKSEEDTPKDEADRDDDEAEDDEERIAIDSFDPKRQRSGLGILLEIILMVHQYKNSMGAWERAFDFKPYFSRLSYAPVSEGGKINPVRLRDFILKMIKETNDLTLKFFCDYYKDSFDIIESKAPFFESEVSNRWEEIEKCIETIKKSEKVFVDARIGVIQLTNVSPLDAQNIFSRINSGGTQLKAEELLSAKPFWNEVVYADSRFKSVVYDLYERLGVDKPESVVKWDLCATLLDRISDRQLLFDVPDKDKKDVDVGRITLGFKLVSSVFRGGMSAKSVGDLEKSDKKPEIKWEEDIDNLICDVSQVCEILENCSFFKYLQSWNTSIYKLMGSAIVLEFITITLKNWYDKGKPTSGSKMQDVQRDARILFDKLVYEYASGAWRGSGDSKMASHIANWKERLIKVDKDSWTQFIKGACSGEFNGQNIVLTHLTPVLYYSYMLLEKAPTSSVDVVFEVDHIVPQAKFDGDSSGEKRKRDSLVNLALLPKKDNISKRDKELREITDSWLKNQIMEYTGIPESSFVTYSDIINFDDMKAFRMEEFLRIFGYMRDSNLSNK